MNRLQYIGIFIIVLCVRLYSQPATTVVISEVAPMGGSSSQYNTGEFIELYNPFAVDITFGPNVKIVSGATPPGTNAAEWEVSLAGKTIKAYGFLLIGDGGVAVTPDIYFPANKNLSNSGIRSCVQLRDGETVLDAFAWDASTTLSGEGTRFTPTSTTSDGKSFERKSSASATGPDNLGNAWDSNNNATDFFQNSSAAKNPQNSSSPIEVNPYNLYPAEGKGVAVIAPKEWKYSEPTTLVLSVSSPVDTVRAFRFVMPTILHWVSNNVVVTPESALISFAYDTITVTNVSICNSDSVTVAFSNVTANDTTAQPSFSVMTSRDGVAFYPLLGQPTTLVYGSPRPMSWVKRKDASGIPIHNNQYVVVKGVVTVANEFGGPSYLEDATAAIAVYDSSVSRYVTRGDEVVLLGRVAPYFELFELSPCKILEKVSEGNTFDTLVLTIPQIKAQPQKGVEPYECKLVRISNITAVLTTTNNEPTTTWSVTGTGTNYKIVSGIDTMEVRILPRTNVANTSIPSGTFDIVGVLGQYYTTYQLQPRSLDDIILVGSGPRIISGIPYESTIGATAVTFRWVTDQPSTTVVYYGTSTNYTNKIVDPNPVTVHEITISGLQPATAYYAKFGSSTGSDTTFTFPYLFSTASATSTGTINVYFTKSVDHSVAGGENAVAGTLYQRLVNRINAATSTIDAAFYSLSGTVGGAIANALVSAKQRGVRVRVIGEKDNSNTAAWSTLQSNGVPVLFDNVDAVNYGQGYMHNKFVVIDNGEDGDDTNDWVWTGSWNATDPGDNNDAQNVIEIQDKALARAYTMEFEEMWGSATTTPNTANARFGSHKTDNTPHFFNVNGVPIELYFSPSDGTTSKIIKALNKAQESINFAILSFTRNDIANALTYKFRNGVKVRGIFDNRTDTGCEFDTLLARGLDVRLKANLTGYLHHKYAIIDANGADSNKFVITGSHNWSSSAEYSNDENTLIIQSPRLANLFLQEFSQRYKDAGGTDILLEVDESPLSLQTYSLSQNYPNPFNPTTTIEFQVPSHSFTTLKVYDVLGREVAQLVNEVKSPGTYRVVWDASSVASGVYFYKLTSGPYVSTKRMVVVK